MSFLVGRAQSDNINLSANTFLPLVVSCGKDTTNLLAYSTNGGSTWTKTGGLFGGTGTVNLQSIATNGSIWVAVGNKGTGGTASVYSYDGKNWISFTIDSTNDPQNFSTITWNGKLFVTGSQTPAKMHSSYDGITWTVAPITPFSTQVLASMWITQNTGTYVINGFWLSGGVGGQSMAYSFDGITWNTMGTNSPFGTSGSAYALAWDGSGLIVAGGTGSSQSMAYISLTSNFDPTGTWTWTSLGSSAPFGTTGTTYAIAYNGRVWVAGGTGNSQSLAYSFDGKNWTALGSSSPFGTSANSECRAVCWTGVYWVVVGKDAASATISLAYATDPRNTWTTDSGSITFTSSGFGVTAGSLIMPPKNDGIFAGGNMIGLQFQKGTQNTINFISGGNQVASIGEKGFKKLAMDEQYGTFIKTPVCLAAGVLSSGTNFYYSFDSKSFTSSAANPFSTAAYEIAYNGKIWVAVGEGGNTLAYSTNGIAWTANGATIFTTQARGVVWMGTMFVAAGSGTNTLAYSFDGINWTGLGASIFTTLGYSFAWNGSLLIALGSGTNTIAYSYDGISWTGLGTSIFSTQGYSAVWNGSIFVATGSGTNTLAWSRNGITWTGLGTSIFSTSGNSVAWSGTYFAAAGIGTNTLAYSTNGTSWTGLGVTIFSTKGNGVAWTGTYFVATGDGAANRLAYSTSGNDATAYTGLGTGFFGGGGNGGERVIGGYWKWSGDSVFPSLELRTQGRPSAGIIGTNNGLAITGNGKTLQHINDQSNLISTNTTINAAATITGATILSSTVAISGIATFSAAIAASGSGSIDFSGSSGLFKTSTGAITLGGNTSVITIGSGATPATSIVVSSGTTGAIDFSNSSGLFKTSTGAVTIGSGAVTVSGNTAFTKVGTTTISSSPVYINPSSTTGSASTFYFTYLTAPVISGTTATVAYSLYIDGAPTNTTTSYALYISSGTAYFGGSVQFASALSFSTTIQFTGAGGTTESTGTIYVAPASTTLTGANDYYFTYFNTPTTTGAGTSGIVSTVYIEDAPANSGAGAKYALNIAAGASLFGGSITGNSGLTITSGNVSFSGSSGTFSTTTGAVTIGTGAVTVSGNTAFTKVGTTTISSSPVYINPSSTTGSASTFYFTYLTAPVISGTTATVAYSLYIDGAPTNTTTSYALYISTGASLFGGAISASGSGSIDFSGSSGLFKTSTGAVTIGGTTSTITIGSGTTPSTNIVVSTGTTGAIDFSNASGAFKTTTGAVTIGGTTSTITIGSGTTPSTNIVVSTGTTGAIDFSNASGAFKTTTGAVTIGGTNSTITIGSGTTPTTNIVVSTGTTGAIDFSNSSGAFKTTTGAVTIGTGAVTVSGNTAFTKVGTTTISSSPVYINPSSTTGSASTFYFTYLTAPVISGTTATIAYSLYIDGAPTNTTTSYALYISTGASLFGGAISASGSGSIDFSGSSGLFKTSTGAVTIGGTTSTITIGSGTTPSTNIVVSTGTTGAIDFSNASGAFKTTTGAVTIGGTNSTITIGSGTTPTTNIVVSTGTTGAIDFSNSSGAFKTTTGAVTIGTGAVTVSGNTAFTKVGTTTISSSPVYINPSSTTGSASTFYFTYLTAPVISGTTATIAYSLYIDGAPTNTTTSYALYISTGASLFGGAISASGSGSIDFSGSSGLFKTSTGAVTIGGTTSTITIGSGTTPSTNIVVSTGTTGAIDFSNASGAFKTTTGAVTIGGTNSTITIGSGTTPTTNIVVSTGTTGAIDFSNSSGAFKTTTGAVTLGGYVFLSSQTTLTANTTLDFTANKGNVIIVPLNPSSTTITITLPTTTSNTGLMYYFVHKSSTGTSVISVANTATETFDNGSTSISLVTQYDHVRLTAYNDGTIKIWLSG